MPTSLAACISQRPAGVPRMTASIILRTRGPAEAGAYENEAVRQPGSWGPALAGPFNIVPHCTFAVTLAGPFSVNVHVFVLLPPLEQEPDQTTSRLSVARSVIEVPTVNDADPVLPTATLIPVGVEVTRSPLLPVAVTVSVAV